MLLTRVHSIFISSGILSYFMLGFVLFEIIGLILCYYQLIGMTLDRIVRRLLFASFGSLVFGLISILFL